jgi:hypothetical protein
MESTAEYLLSTRTIQAASKSTQASLWEDVSIAALRSRGDVQKAQMAESKARSLDPAIADRIVSRLSAYAEAQKRTQLAQLQVARQASAARAAQARQAEEDEEEEREERRTRRANNLQAFATGLQGIMQSHIDTKNQIAAWRARDAERNAAIGQSYAPAPSYSAPAPQASYGSSIGQSSRVANTQSFGGTDATSCVSMQNEGTQRAFVNTCAHPISMRWCYNDEISNDPGCQNYHNMLTISAGGRWPIKSGVQYFYGACRGRDTIRSGSGRRHTCEAER